MWLGLAVAALLVVALCTLNAWRRVLRSARAHDLQPAIGAFASGMAALLLVPWAMRDGGVALISYGGSPTVALFVLAGLIMRLEREAGPSVQSELATGN